MLTTQLSVPAMSHTAQTIRAALTRMRSMLPRSVGGKPNLTLWLYAVATVALVPVYIIVLFGYYTDRRAAEATSLQDVRLYSEMAALRLEQTLNRAFEDLQRVPASSALIGPGCEQVLARVRQNSVLRVSVYVADTAGNVLCQSDGPLKCPHFSPSKTVEIQQDQRELVHF